MLSVAAQEEALESQRAVIRARAEKALVLANLNLHAVLPRLEELVKLDAHARELADALDLSVRFAVRGGPFVTLAIGHGTVKTSFDRSARYDVGLLFSTCDKLNAMFAGAPVTPLPFKGFLKLGRMKLFTELSNLLTRYLKPSDADMQSPEFRVKHLEMLLMTGLAGTADIARFDRKLRKVASHLPVGTMLVKVLPDGPSAHVVIREGADIAATNGPVDAPTTTLEMHGVDVAIGLLSKKIDSFAALGAGTVRASGLLPLADEYNALLDRVGYYLS